MTARWGCLVLGLFIIALLLLILVAVRVGGLPLSQESTSDQLAHMGGEY